MGGRTVRIYMADGSPFGIRQAEIFNRTIQALGISRSRLGELKEDEWSEARGAGVYFLFGKAESEGGKPKSYIGEAQNVIERIGNHVREKGFWTEAILFVSKDKNINREYLEARLISEASSANRYELDNGKTQSLPNLSRSDKDAMEEMIPDIRLILGVLGHPILEPETEPENSKERNSVRAQEFSFSGRDFDARGRVTDEGFLILSGSTAAPEVTGSVFPGYKQLRERLLEQGVLVKDQDRLKFTRDYLTTSSSQAAAIVAGGNRSGPLSWKMGSQTLGELEAAAIAPVTAPNPGTVT